jgi:hypothetical protein
VQRIHKDKVAEYTDYKAQWKAPGSAPSQQSGLKRKENLHETSSCTLSEPQLKQAKLVRTVDVVSQAKVDKLVTQFVVKGMHPLSTVEQMEFIQLVTGLCPSAAVMSRRTLGRRIDDTFVTRMLDIKEQLAQQQYVCTTADVWSTSKRSYMGVTVHWIDTVSFDRCSAALACRRFKGKHTYDRIAELLYDINNEFGLSHNKIMATVTDNGANFVKAFKEFNVDIVVVATETDPDSEVNETDGDDVAGDAVEFLEINENTTGYDQEADVGGSEVILPTHLRCASHTLSLIGTTDASSALKSSASFSRLNHAAMGKCSSLWNSSSRPKSAELIEEMCGCQLTTPCATRWNSLYDSISKLLDKRSVLPKLMPALNLPCFKDMEIDFLEEYCRTLAPIAVALDRLQGEHTCYYADLLPTLFKVNSQLTQLQSVNFRHCTPLLTAVTAGFQCRFKSFLELSPEAEVNIAVLATMTHPYFKLRWLPVQFADQQSRLKGLLISTAKAMWNGIPNICDQPSGDDTDDDYFAFADKCESDTQPVQGQAVHEAANKCDLEVLQYLEDKNKDLSILNSYQMVKKVFIRYNAVLPSSAAVERLFSFAGMITRPHRRSMSDKTFEHLLLLKGNK